MLQVKTKKATVVRNDFFPKGLFGRNYTNGVKTWIQMLIFNFLRRAHDPSESIVFSF